MEQYINKDQLKEYLILPSTFDWDLVDQEIGFGKIFDIFPKQMYLSLEAASADPEKEIYRLLTKAGVYYSFIFSIPKIKVHITNYGIQEFNQDKVKTAPWWDVRDLGLSMLKIADKCLSDALVRTSKIDVLKRQIPFFSKVSEFVSTPEEFEKIYSINYSPEMFLQLQKFIKKAILLNVYEKINPNCIPLIKANEELLSFLQDALVFYSLYYASMLPGFVFTQNAVVIQYEELPWQKSVILDDNAKILSGKNFLKLADESIKIVTDYIKSHIDEFPCYSPPTPYRKMQSRDSGIYL